MNLHGGGAWRIVVCVKEADWRLLGSFEDPATGSAASALTAYLALTEGSAQQTLDYVLTQGVEMGRRSDIQIQVQMSEETGIDKLVLGGAAVRVMEGRLTV